MEPNFVHQLYAILVLGSGGCNSEAKPAISEAFLAHRAIRQTA